MLTHDAHKYGYARMETGCVMKVFACLLVVLQFYAAKLLLVISSPASLQQTHTMSSCLLVSPYILGSQNTRPSFLTSRSM